MSNSDIYSFSEQIVNREPIVDVIFLTIACSLGVFLLYALLYRNSIEKYGIITTIRRIVFMIRYLIIIEMFVLLPLIYFCVYMGPPIAINAITSYGSGDSWIYGYGRPLAGIMLIGVGTFCDAHYIVRYTCLIGCIAQVAFDSISAIQVSSYLDSVESNSAPTGKYSTQSYQFYVWRDIISLGLCFLIALFLTNLTMLLGWGKQRFAFWEIEGGEMDRAEVMREQYDKKQEKERKKQLLMQQQQERQPLLQRNTVANSKKNDYLFYKLVRYINPTTEHNTIMK